MGRLRTLARWLRDDRATTTGADLAEYVCLGCESGFEARHHVCPECGGFSVDRRTPTEV
jgi:hypothetical protein